VTTFRARSSICHLLPHVKHLMLPCLETCVTHRFVEPPRLQIRSTSSFFTLTDSFSSLCFPLPLLECQYPAYESFTFAVRLSQKAQQSGSLQFCLDMLEDFEFNPYNLRSRLTWARLFLSRDSRPASQITTKQITSRGSRESRRRQVIRDWKEYV